MNRWFKDECPSKIWEQTKVYVRRNKKTKSACLLGWACTIYVNPQSAPIDRLICLFFCFFLHKTLSISKFCIIYAFIFLVSFFVHIFFSKWALPVCWAWKARWRTTCPLQPACKQRMSWALICCGPNCEPKLIETRPWAVLATQR